MKQIECESTGICESAAINENETISNCIHCGGEMFKEGGFWWHHTQVYIPIEERGTVHTGI